MSEIRSGPVADGTPPVRHQAGQQAPTRNDRREQPIATQHMEYSSFPPAWRAKVSLPSFASLDSSARDESTRRDIVKPDLQTPIAQHMSSVTNKSPVEEARARESTCVCSNMTPLIFSAGRLIPGLNESANRSVSKSEYDEFLTGRSAPLQSMQWIVEQLSNIDISLRSSKQALAIPRFSESGSSVSGARSPSRADAFDTPLSPRKRLCKEIEPATEPYNLPYLELGRRTSQTDSAHAQLQSPADSVSRLLPSPATSSAPSYGSGQPPTLVASSSGRLSVSSTSAPLASSGLITPVASDYVADLQHRITMKSMALQSLQAEHTNLLQQMHRDSAKYEASKKKADVANQEISELFVKNEELVGQVKDVQTEIADLETRREEEGQSYARDREQWSRMLDMSGRLHRKVEDSNRRLQEDNDRLEERVRWYEQRTEARFEQHSQDSPDTVLNIGAATSQKRLSQSDADRANTGGSPSASPTSRLAEQSSATINMYRSQIDTLRTALDAVRQQNISISEKARELHVEREEIISAIDSALNHDIQRTHHL